MIKRKLITACILLVICMMAAGCAKTGKKESEIPKIEEPGSGENGPDVVTFEGGEDGKEEKVPAFIIKKEDADSLIEEELSGSGCSAEYKEALEIDESGYYTYTVKDPDGKVMDRMLAVDGFSGDVKVYDFGLKKISDFSEFPYYEKTARRFKDISWDGTYVKGNTSVELLPADDSSFEFEVKEKDKTILSGIALIEKDEAVFTSEDEKEELKFKMTGTDKLEMTEKGDLKISGEYKRK